LLSDNSFGPSPSSPEAEEKALDAYTNCLKFDKDNIYKEDGEVLNNFIQTAARVKRKADFYLDNKKYDEALKCYDLLEATIPYDTKEGNLKKNNITKEALLHNRFLVYKASGNMEKTKEYAAKLIESKYNDPRLYTDMVRLSLQNKDTTAALDYIDKGKVQFATNMDLIAQELDIYIARKKNRSIKRKAENSSWHFSEQ